MVQEDANFTIIAALVPECVLDFGLLSSGCTSEVVVTHGNGNVTLEFDIVIVVHAVRPALAAIDRKAAILSIAVFDRFAADKVGHGLLGLGPELVLGCLGRLEEHVALAVCVELASCLCCRLNVVATFFVHLGDVFDRTRPRVLHGDHIFLGDR